MPLVSSTHAFEELRSFGELGGEQDRRVVFEPEDHRLGYRTGHCFRVLGDGLEARRPHDLEGGVTELLATGGVQIGGFDRSAGCDDSALEDSGALTAATSTASRVRPYQELSTRSLGARAPR